MRAWLDPQPPAGRACQPPRASPGNAVFRAGWTAPPQLCCCRLPAAAPDRLRWWMSRDAAPRRAQRRSSTDASPATHASLAPHASPGPEARSRPAALLVAARRESPPHFRCGTYDASAFPPGAIRRAPVWPHAVAVGWSPPLLLEQARWAGSAYSPELA